MTHAKVLAPALAALALGAVAIRSAHAQQKAVPPPVTINVNQLASLQAQVNSLQATVSALQAVIQVSGSNVTVAAPGQLTLSSANVNVKGSANVNVNGGARVSLNGGLITLN